MSLADHIPSLPLAADDGRPSPYVGGLDAERARRLADCAEAFPVLRYLGMSLDAIDTDLAVMSLAHRVELSQPMGALHGGIIATLIDTAVGWAMASTLKEGFTVLTAGLDVKYFKAVLGGRVTATARIPRKGRQLLHGEVNVVDDAGDLVARGWCIYVPAAMKRAGGPA